MRVWQDQARRGLDGKQTVLKVQHNQGPSRFWKKDNGGEVENQVESGAKERHRSDKSQKASRVWDVSCVVNADVQKQQHNDEVSVRAIVCGNELQG